MAGWIECNNLCMFEEERRFDFVADKLGEYMNVVQWITDDNSEQVCEGYKKLPPSSYYDGTDRDYEDWGGECYNELSVEYNNGYGFLTNDGMLFNFARDGGNGNGSVVDVNGPKGPNIYGRDIFLFYLL
mgnify:CR=1 FL=1